MARRTSSSLTKSTALRALPFACACPPFAEGCCAVCCCCCCGGAAAEGAGPLAEPPPLPVLDTTAVGAASACGAAEGEAYLLAASMSVTGCSGGGDVVGRNCACWCG